MARLLGRKKTAVGAARANPKTDRLGAAWTIAHVTSAVAIQIDATIDVTASEMNPQKGPSIRRFNAFTGSRGIGARQIEFSSFHLKPSGI
jgi:hypothetical protein